VFLEQVVQAALQVEIQVDQADLSGDELVIEELQHSTKLQQKHTCSTSFCEQQ
jgi:hypothetical protein